jgi:hypothetical protein
VNLGEGIALNVGTLLEQENISDIEPVAMQIIAAILENCFFIIY